jgi:hypothetical protein
VSRERITLGTEGLSMWPWLRPGGSIVVERCPPEALRRGDIAVWFQGRRFVAHRVVRRMGSLVVTRGDWSMEDDPPVGEAQLLGRVLTRGLGPFSVRLDRAPVRAAGLAFQLLLRVARRLSHRASRA